MLKQYEEHWEKTNDNRGIRPKFNKCPMCGNKMVVRNSLLEYENKGDNNFDNTVLFDKVRLKCIRCAFIAPFCIIYENDYWAKVLSWRKNVRLYYPPAEEWASEDEQVAEQLRSMGYFD